MSPQDVEKACAHSYINNSLGETEHLTHLESIGQLKFKVLGGACQDVAFPCLTLPAFAFTTYTIAASVAVGGKPWLGKRARNSDSNHYCRYTGVSTSFTKNKSLTRNVKISVLKHNQSIHCL